MLVILLILFFCSIGASVGLKLVDSGFGADIGVLAALLIMSVIVFAYGVKSTRRP